ncbi:heat stress transcription factor A-2c-like isoform X2 [Triticum dicoccoides]|uniref:heat stress transcription factor A-2c-like isoform X2 n=1 Tax=Triticum dicoccoides TaxID=85692 RepID=UPI001890714E|nr:heat stress transcription factor A-2c-like isoform X2 [Triticum dicoccoides]
MGPRRQHLRRLGPARLRRGTAPAPLQALQLLQLRPPAQHLSTRWNKILDEVQEPDCFVLEDSTDDGFRKVDPDRWEFANEGFLRGQRHLLKMIKRRKPPSNAPSSQQQALTSCLEVGEFGFEEEIDRLKRDKNLLITEVVKLRQEQQATKDNVQAMEGRLRAAEQRQAQMMGFLARAMRNPHFFQQLVQKQDKRKELEDAISKKRRRPIDNAPFYGPAATTSQSEQLDSQFLFDSGVLSEPGMNGMENLAQNIQELGQGKTDEEKKDEANGQLDINNDFWAELFSDDFGDGDGSGLSELEGRRPEDIDELAQQLGYLSSTSPQ